jgi:hypothetical protein
VEYDRTTRLVFSDRPEQIWVVVPKNGTGIPVEAFTSEKEAKDHYQAHGSGLHSAEPATLHRPSLQPIYGGPTLLEALWTEMDRLMEGLMTQADAEDGGDRFRAAELAWVLAIVTNAYAPSVDKIREEAINRWNAQQEEQDV